MPLMLDAPPAGTERVIDAAVAELAGHGAIAFGRKQAPAVSPPLRLFNLGAEAVAAGKGLEAAVQTGWLATLRNGEEVLGALELAPAKRAKAGAPALRFGSFTAGPLHRGLAEALDAAHRRVGRAKVQAAVLRAPALYLMALWLKDGAEDVLVPIAPTPPPLKPREPIPAARALEALREAAKAAMSGDERRS